MRWSSPSPLARRRIAWAAVFAANLPAPVLFGLGFVGGGGRVGLMLAVALAWFLGHELCRYQPRAIWTVIPGAWVIAASQVYPIPHVIAGTLGLWLAGAGPFFTEDGRPPPLGPLAGFAATLLTGGLLLTVAAVLGLMIRALFWPEGPPGKPPAARDELA